ncbi:MAG: EscU/YscU/HrcU family type III secretion system export apparatus switch protein [Nitrospinae bacterium]|nr:EscU/YscU/HrcU family type III secretion system export apparatus switch protein [Nitrospinota bacterium]
MKKNLPPKREQAVTLKYDPEVAGAPRVTAKGSGLIARKIIELARKHNIPVKEDPDLMQILSRLELNQEIPSSVYRVVAEVLAFVYSLNQKYGMKKE